MSEVNESERLLFYSFEIRPGFFDEFPYPFVKHEAL